MKRREFIAGLGVAMIYPLEGSPQAQRPIPIVGFLSSDLTAASDLLVSFREGLRAEGYVEGRNVEIDFLSAEGHYEKLPALVSDLLGRKVTVLVVVGAVTGPLAAKAATTTIPIVFVVGSDPVRWGLVASLSRPGGNITGVTISSSELLPKRIELLRALVPDAVSIGFLVNPNNPNAEPDVKNVADIAQAGAWILKVLKVTKEQELEGAFDEFAKSQVGGVTSGNDALFASWRQQIANLANRNKLPVIQSSRQFAVAGGLIAYGPRLDEVNRTAGNYTARILEGINPADLPVWYPTQFDLIINLKTAKAISLTIPPSILARADEVIE